MAFTMQRNSLNPEDFNRHVIQRQGLTSPLYREQYQYQDPVRGPTRPVSMDDTYNIPTPAQNIACQSLVSEDKCSHCGWVRKRSFFSKFFSWPQAYAVLNDGCLYYFKRETAKSPSGQFSLYGYSSVFRASDVPSREAPWAFKIVHSHSEFKTYYFAASSEKEMKVWMRMVKSEMMKANGKALRLKDDKEGKDDDPTFYNEVECSIYDDAHKFLVTKDYTKNCSIKREDDVSDDEDLCLNINPTINTRPPQPLPEQAPTPPPRPDHQEAPLKPSRLLDIDQDNAPRQRLPPLTPPRERSGTHLAGAGTSTPTCRGPQIDTHEVTSALASLAPLRKHKRKSSYEKTDGPGYKSPTLSRKAAQQPGRASSQVYNPAVQPSSGGGSTGDEEYDPEEYWSSVYTDSDDKQRANDIIQALGDPGVYLVRPEGAGSGKVIVVYAENQIKKYRIKKNDDEQYFLAKEGYKHVCLEHLLCYYYDNDLPTVAQKLTMPYKLHKKYKDLHL